MKYGLKLAIYKALRWPYHHMLDFTYTYAYFLDDVALRFALDPWLEEEWPPAKVTTPLSEIEAHKAFLQRYCTSDIDREAARQVLNVQVYGDPDPATKPSSVPAEHIDRLKYGGYIWPPSDKPPNTFEVPEELDPVKDHLWEIDPASETTQKPRNCSCQCGGQCDKGDTTCF